MNKKKLWQLYTAEAEYKTSFKDIYDRNLVQLCRPGNILEAELSDYFIQEGFNPSYPKNKEFACCISHDIDLLYPNSWGKEFVKAGLKGSLPRMGEAFKKIFSPAFDSRYELVHLFELEKSYGIPASYYFLSIEKDDPEDFNYRVTELGPYVEDILSIGGEIGLHGSKWAYNDPKILSIELNRLKGMHPNIVGYRNHYLKFELPTSWKILAEAGFQYDTSYGDSRSPGFRNGICYPFQPFDPQSQSWIDIYEIPLIAMDVSFFNYLKLDHEMAFKLFVSLVETVKSYKGVFSFLWHNNYMQGEERKFYEKCLNHLHKKNAYFTTGKGLINWWESQGYFQQQKEILKNLIAETSYNQ